MLYNLVIRVVRVWQCKYVSLVDFCMYVCIYLCMYVCMYLCMYNKTIDEYSKNMLKCMYACERLSLCMWTGGFSNFVCTVCMFICIYKCIYIFLYACNMEVCTMAWCHWIFIIVCVFKLILCYLLCSLFRSECQRR